MNINNKAVRYSRGHQMNNKKYETSIQSRQLLYKNNPQNSHTFELPQKYRSKISHLEYKRIKEAFYLNASSDNFQLNRQTFAATIRSLGVIAKTSMLLRCFDNFKQPKMNWYQFIDAYLGLRNNKGSYKEVDTAIGLLDREYKGKWEQLDRDLCQIGDILTKEELKAFKQLMGNRTINADNLKNVLLGYK